MSYVRNGEDGSDVYVYEDSAGGYTTHVWSGGSGKEAPAEGDKFNDPTLEAVRERLLALREAGYVVPDFVFETIDIELIFAPLVAPQA